MMNTLAKNIFSVVLFVGLPVPSRSVGVNASDDTLKGIVDKYLAARQATMLQAATHADVDNLLAFYTEDIVYEHPRVKMRVEGKARIREGMLRFLGVTKGTQLVIGNRISNINMVVAEYRVTFKAQEGSSWKEFSRTQVTLFEFEGDKIKRVVDYW